MTQTFTTEAVVRLRDEVTQALNALAARTKATNNRMAKDALDAERAARNAAGRGAAAATEQVSRLAGAWKEVKAAAVEAAGVMAGIAAMKSLRAGAEIQHQWVSAQLAGMSDLKATWLRNQAAEIAGSREGVGVKQSSIMKTGVELRSIMTTEEHAKEALPLAIQAQRALDATGHHTEGLVQFFKSAEQMGLALRPDDFKDFAEHFVKARQALGDTITPETILKSTGALGVEANVMGKEFRDTIWFSLVQEMREKAGTSLQMFNKQVTGGFNGTLHPAAAEFVRLGLARKEQFNYDKNGNLQGLKAGERLDHVDEWLANPFEFVKMLTEKGGVFDKKAGINELAAAQSLYGKGIKQADLDELLKHEEKKAEIRQRYESLVISEFRRLFPSGKASDALVKMFQQAEAFSNHAKIIEGATGLDISHLTSQDALITLEYLSNALQDLGGTLTQPIMGQAAQVMFNMARGIAEVSKSLLDWQTRNPTEAKIAAGAAGVGALGTMGLGAIALRNFIAAPVMANSAATVANTEALIANTAARGLAGGATAVEGAGAGAVAAEAGLGAGGVAGLIAGVGTMAWAIWQTYQSDKGKNSEDAQFGSDMVGADALGGDDNPLNRPGRFGRGLPRRVADEWDAGLHDRKLPWSHYDTGLENLPPYRPKTAPLGEDDLIHANRVKMQGWVTHPASAEAHAQEVTQNALDIARREGPAEAKHDALEMSRGLHLDPVEVHGEVKGESEVHLNIALSMADVEAGFKNMVANVYTNLVGSVGTGSSMSGSNAPRRLGSMGGPR